MAEDYFVQLLGTRANWPNEMTERERQIMQEHAVYLRELLAKKKVLIAGPVWEEVFGLVIVRVNSRDEAEKIAAEDPSVVQGVHTYRLRPMDAALQAHHVPAARYPEPVSDKELRKEIDVPAGIEQVWAAWTTEPGIRSFFCENCRIELRPGGPFEVYFSLEAPEGSRGSEDCAILSYDPPTMFSFEWNAPPQFGAIRDQRTIVILHFDHIDDRHTRVRLVQRGWGTGEGWEKLYEYFDSAWDFVLSNLQKSFAGQK